MLLWRLIVLVGMIVLGGAVGALPAEAVVSAGVAAALVVAGPPRPKTPKLHQRVFEKVFIIHHVLGHPPLLPFFFTDLGFKVLNGLPGGARAFYT